MARDDSVLSTQYSALSLAPEITHLRALFEQVVAARDAPEELAAIEAEVRVAVHLVSALVALIKVECDLHPPDDEAATAHRALAAILSRAAARAIEQ